MRALSSVIQGHRGKALPFLLAAEAGLGADGGKVEQALSAIFFCYCLILQEGLFDSICLLITELLKGW